MLSIWSTNEALLFVICLIAFFIALEIGFRFGTRNSAKHDEKFGAHISSLQGAVLGLLALLLGFTFAMSVSRFDVRKQMILEEANAIGTTYLRAQLLPEPHNVQAQKILKSYVDARLEFNKAGIDQDKLKAAHKKGLHIQDQLWGHAVEASQSPKNALSVSLFIESLNNLIDVNEKRFVAFENHVPEAVIILLFFVSVTGMGFISYSYGLTDQRRHISTALFAFMIAVVLTVILDIDRPHRGLIQVSDNSLIRLQETLNHDHDSNPSHKTN